MPDLIRKDVESSKKEKAKQDIRQLVYIQDYEMLMRYDEFQFAKKDCECLKNFQEG